MSVPNRACPACVSQGRDSKGDHLFLMEDKEKWCCSKVLLHPDNQYFLCPNNKDTDEPIFDVPEDTMSNMLGPELPTYDKSKSDPNVVIVAKGESPRTATMPSPDSVGSGSPLDFLNEPSVAASTEPNERDIESLPCIGMRGMPDSQYAKYGCKTGLSGADGKTPESYYYPLFLSDGHKLWKIRLLPKTFFTSESLPEGGKLRFMGQHLHKNQRQLLITEGQDDAIAADFIINKDRTKDNQVLCVSLPNGANVKSLRDNTDFIDLFDRVIFDPDGDDAGQELIEKVVSLRPDMLLMVKSEKDACDMLKEGRTEEYIRSFVKAAKYRPASVVNVADVAEKLFNPVAIGLSYPWQSLTDVTYGAVPHQIVSVGSGPGVGKSSVIRAIQQHFMFHHETPCGIFSLEDTTEQALRYLVGYMMNERIHIPGQVYSGDEAVRLAKSLDGRAYFYDNRYFKGEWDNIEKTVRFMYHDGVKHFFIDPVSALAAHLDSSAANTFINTIMIKLSRLIQELDIYIMLVNHLNNPTSGASHEEGGRVLPSQFTGSKGQWRYSTDMWGFERNLLSEDPELKNKMIIRNLKHRADGNMTGRTCDLKYSATTGRLEDPKQFQSVITGVPDIQSTSTTKQADSLGDILGD